MPLAQSGRTGHGRAGKVRQLDQMAFTPFGGSPLVYPFLSSHGLLRVRFCIQLLAVDLT